MQMVVKTTTTPVDGTATTTTETLNFSYDASGVPLAVDYNGTDYYYVTSIQGDVMAILDTSGTAVVEYTYDAWGNIHEVSGTLAETLGKTNPLRYRGYVYHTDTGFYYLQSRYYDPDMDRFINADACTLSGQGLLDANMYVYSRNNPVLGCDPNGTSFTVALVAMGIGALTSILSTVAVNNINGDKTTATDIVIAGACGAVSTFGVVGAVIGCSVNTVHSASKMDADTPWFGSVLSYLLSVGLSFGSVGSLFGITDEIKSVYDDMFIIEQSFDAGKAVVETAGGLYIDQATQPSQSEPSNGKPSASTPQPSNKRTIHPGQRRITTRVQCFI